MQYCISQIGGERVVKVGVARCRRKGKKKYKINLLSPTARIFTILHCIIFKS
jgi:hypothetical protein